MGLKAKNKGLRFKYNIGDMELRDTYTDIEDFLNTTFPKKGNKLSPIMTTKIRDIRWNGNLISINKSIKTLSDLAKILSGECYVSNKDIRFTEFSSCTANLERKEIYPIEQIRELTKDVLFERDKKLARINLDGDLIKGNSERYQTFFTKGCKCVECGIEGKYFAKEKHRSDTVYHLNLYAVDDNGEEVLITKDHILPKSKGGKNDIDNYQPMCEKCNKAKGNQII